MPKARTLPAIAAASILLAAALPAAAEHKPNPHFSIECTYCHEDTPRFGIDTRETVNFWRAKGDEPRLCERCHTPEENFHPLYVTPGAERLGTRKPTHLPLGASEDVRDMVVCTTCHFIHTANADNALLRGLPGSQNPIAFPDWQTFCRECHGEGLEKRSPHTGDERSCAFCHAARPKMGEKVDVTEKGLRLCVFCHGQVDEKHYAGVNPFATIASCATCHDPHLGKDHPARLRDGYFEPLKGRVTINPHLKRTLCFACHVDPDGGPLRTNDPVALCQRCHGSGEISGMSHPLSKVPAEIAIPAGWPLVEDRLTCLTCHLPGHLEDKGRTHFLRGGFPERRNDICFFCHKKETWADRNPHEKAASDKAGCEFCHARKPSWGKDTSQTVAFNADVTILCLRCHAPEWHPVSVNHTVTLEGGVPEEYAKDLPLGPGNRITCGTCHNPHSNRFENHLLRGYERGSGFCSKCHKL